MFFFVKFVFIRVKIKKRQCPEFYHTWRLAKKKAAGDVLKIWNRPTGRPVRADTDENENVTTKVAPPLFATKTRRKAKARRIFLYFSFVSSKNFEPSWLLAA